MSSQITVTGRALTTQQPSEFIARKLNEGATRFTLYILGVEGSRTRLDSWDALALTFEEVRDAIEAKAERHAGISSTVANFLVEAFDAQRESLGLETFRVSAQALPGAAGALMSEPANEAGVLAMSMRHAEVAMRVSVGAQQHLFGRFETYLDRLEKRVADSEDKRVQVFQLIEDLASKKHEREMEELRENQKHELKQKAFEKFAPLVMLAANAMMGKVKPEGQALTAANLAKELFESLTAEQLQGILGHLGPEQAAMVLQAYRTMIKQKEEANGATSNATTRTQH